MRDLFFNVPARRKFLRTEATEYQHVVRMLERLALSRFDVAFRWRTTARSVWSLPAARTAGGAAGARREASAARILPAHVIELKHDTESLRLSGWLALPTFSRSQSDLQFAFLNGRFVRDKLLAGAVRLAYQDVLFHGRFPAYLLYLELDPTQVDVNAHPQKLEVRFRDSRRIHDFVFRTLERVLAETRPEHRIVRQRAARLAHGQCALRWRCGAEPGALCAARGQRRCARAGCLSWPCGTGGFGRDQQHGGAANAGRRRPYAGRRHAGCGSALGLCHRAAAWRLHTGADRRRHGAGGHACGA